MGWYRHQVTLDFRMQMSIRPIIPVPTLFYPTLSLLARTDTGESKVMGGALDTFEVGIMELAQPMLDGVDFPLNGITSKQQLKAIIANELQRRSQEQSLAGQWVESIYVRCGYRVQDIEKKLDSKLGHCKVISNSDCIMYCMQLPQRYHGIVRVTSVHP
eukprot:gene20851-7741_t